MFIINENIPAHIGIIMDGNGRWAKKRGLPRKFGHKEGAKTFKKCVDYCIELGIKFATFYAFSTENKMRPKEEVEALIGLFDDYLDDIRKMDNKNVRLRFLGALEFFPENMCIKMREAEESTVKNTGLNCSLAMNYGGRSDIVQAAKKMITSGINAADLEEKVFANFLYTKEMPDVDMIIRTGGEQRISNFLIWQAAYAEYYFTDVLFPDFRKKDLEKALKEYAERSRRFGK